MEDEVLKSQSGESKKYLNDPSEKKKIASWSQTFFYLNRF